MTDDALLAAMRRSYELGGLSEEDLAPTWLEQFRRWFEDARIGGLLEPNAMVVATADADGRPSARTVLLKGLDERGFVFYTNYESRKGLAMASTGRAALLFPWIELQRQVHVEGTVERVAPAESDAYFASRPLGSRISAAASPQSQLIPSRAELEAARDLLAAEHPDDIPRPSYWGGLRVVPERVEFWQGRRDRLHDRLVFRRRDQEWTVLRLAP